MYDDTFLDYFPYAFGYLIYAIGAFVEEICLDELHASAQSGNKNDASLRTSLQHTPSVEVHIPSMTKRLVAVPGQWFNQYITKFMGTNHDCYILEFDSASKKAVPFSTLVVWHTEMSTSKHGMHFEFKGIGTIISIVREVQSKQNHIFATFF